MYRISFDTAEVAATPTYECGVWWTMCDDSNVRETMESLVMLGFTPTMEIV